LRFVARSLNPVRAIVDARRAGRLLRSVHSMRNVLLGAALLFTLTAAVAAAPPPEPHHALVKVQLDSPAQIRELVKRHLDVVRGETPLEPYVVARPGDFAILNQTGLRWQIVHADLETFYADRARAEGHLDDMGGYKTYSEIAAELDSMHVHYPSLTTAKFSVGTTGEGRALWCLKISDNPEVDEDEPELLYNGLIHAREPAGMEIVIYFMNYLLSHYGTDSEATDLVNTREFFFIPCMNPDGYEYNRLTNPSGGGMWRKNRRNNGDGSYGVDLNRNWGLTWGIDNDGSSPVPSDEDYRGTAAFSELETAACRDFINSRHFSGSIDYHTYSDLVLIPWGTSYWGGTGRTADDPVFRLIADSMSSAISRVNGASYSMGTPWELLYNTNGGSFDWEYGDTLLHQKMYSVTTEAGNSSDGFWPPPSRILPLCAENLAANLFYARYAGTLHQGDPHITASPGQIEVSLVPDEQVTRQLVVNNSGTRNLYYAVGFGGSSVLTDTGGPDAFGYRWWDSNDPCGPFFHWLPISSLGTQLTFGSTDGDAVRGPYSLGFSFPFYGQIYDRVWISANGWISFTDSAYTNPANRMLPSSSAPAAAICAWWDDLKPQLSGTNVRFWSNGADSAAVHYENVRAGTAPSQGTYNFQILLTTRGDVKIFYGDMGTIRLNSATIGIQDHTRTRGLTVLYNQLGVGSNEARRFALGPRWVAAAPAKGMIPPGHSDTLSVLFDGSALCGDPSTASLILRNDDMSNPFVSVRLAAGYGALEPPAELTAAAGPNGVQLRWRSSSHASGYLVDRADDWSGPFVNFAITADTVFTDTSAYTAGGLRFYQVRASSQPFRFTSDLPTVR
jgi:hypothetical protein